MALTLKLQKPGEEAPKLKLNLTKGSKFTVELFWDSKHDLDAHALLATNNGDGAKVTTFEQVLSPYNMKATGGVLELNSDGSFNTPEEALHHSGDARDGEVLDIDEVITIDGSKVPTGVNEIPIFVTIHPAKTATFAEVKDSGIRIKDESGALLGEYMLSNEFSQFDAVQMGTLVLENGAWVYIAAGSGFNGDFNSILAFFS